MRALPIGLMTLLLVASPVLACGGGAEIAVLVEFEVDTVDEALVTAVVPDHARAELLSRLAESQRLLQDGAALRLKDADPQGAVAMNGIEKQSEARALVEGVMKDLSLPIPRPLASPACAGHPVAKREIMLGTKRRTGAAASATAGSTAADADLHRRLAHDDVAPYPALASGPEAQRACTQTCVARDERCEKHRASTGVRVFLSCTYENSACYEACRKTRG